MKASTRRLYPLAALALAVPLSQLGHLIAYGLRLGPTAFAIQASGPHTYYPSLLKTTIAAVAAGLLLSILVVGSARMVRGRRTGARLRRGWPLLPLAAFLVALQLSFFIAQETLEAVVAGMPVARLQDLVAWGLAGQLPVAVLGALGLAWISRRLSPALETIAFTLARLVDVPTLAPLGVATPEPAPAPALLLSVASPSSLVKRGPPFSPRG